MLLEFSVQNFRSFRDRQTLSLVASADKSLEETHTLATGLASLPRVVCSSALYGANASGKSNLLAALEYMQQLVLHSFRLGPVESTRFVPFRLDQGLQNDPGEFEITVLIEGVRYQYGFRIDAQRVQSEWLLVYKTSKGQAWFDRTYNPATGKDEYQFSEKFIGAKKLWQESTRPNALFFSTAVQFNSEMLRPLFEWFATRPVFLNPLPLSADYTITRLEEKDFHDKVVSFLRSSDIPVVQIDVVAARGFRRSTSHDSVIIAAENSGEEVVQKRPLFRHVTDSGEAMFELHEESMGTQRLFALAGPVLDILERGQFLVVDELESSLHPYLVGQLIDLFHDPRRNAKGAQILFSTHNTNLLDLKRFRRDQIWFVQKDASEASSLEPLSDYKVRNMLSLEKAYLQGRFGGVPILPQAVSNGA